MVTIRWEYRLQPTTSTMRFACVSNSEEYRELLQDPTTTITWYFEPVGGLGGSRKPLS